MQARQLAQESGQPMAIVRSRVIVSMIERWRGNPRQSLENVEGLAEIAQQVFNIYTASLISGLRGFASIDIGDYTGGIRLLGSLLPTTEQTANYMIVGRGYNLLGWASTPNCTTLKGPMH